MLKRNIVRNKKIEEKEKQELNKQNERDYTQMERREELVGKGNMQKRNKGKWRKKKIEMIHGEYTPGT